jgi:outer membrane receptor protein involved in Fe transport
MKKLAGHAALLLLMLPTMVFAQNVILTGNIKNSTTSEKVSAVSVALKGTTYGTFTDDNGSFKLSIPTSVKFPATLVISSVGYDPKEVTVNGPGDVAQVLLAPSISMSEEVVVAATRLPTRVLESPVSIERIGPTALRNAPAANYYDMVTNLKGVDMIASSLTFKTPTTRGFGGSGNARFNQIVDGMDNQAPGLNFSVGSIIGLSELDVESMELLPGASSALYGPGGMNGTLIVNSKSPFKYQGFSFQMKNGIMHTDSKYRPAAPYYNWGVRYAKKVSDHFAFKINAEIIQAKDWVAADKRNYKRLGPDGQIVPGTRSTDPNYDGVNTYGDETTADLNQFLTGIGGQAPFLAPYISTLTTKANPVSRTGYDETQVVDPNATNFKLGGSLNYRFNGGVEAILEGFWGTGNAVYTGSERYALKDLKMGQYKLDIVGKNWFLRGYTTQENAGESYNSTVATRLFNEAWKPSYNPLNAGGSWYPQYAQAYLNGKLNGLSDIDAHNAARTVADVGRPEAGSDLFKHMYDSVRLRPISKGGGLLVDRTNVYAAEGQYNLTPYTGKIVDILVGANYRRFVLNSEGTLFADSTGTIPITEYGAYAQLTKALGDNVKLSFSARYDKNSNFKGRVTPRATLLVKLATNSHLRLSYQTAYRFPTNQQQYINLVVGSNSKLIGGVPSMLAGYHFDTNPVYLVSDLSSGKLTPKSFGTFRPEALTSYEVGYRGLVANQRLLIDGYAYWGKYQDFIVRTLVAQAFSGNPADLTNPAKRQILSVPENLPSSEKVTTFGWGMSLEYRMQHGFYVSGNLSSDVLNGVPSGYQAGFNAPRYRTNLIFGNAGFGPKKRLGFNVTYRWQDNFYWEADFANGDVYSYHVLDAQISYKFPSIKSVVRLGGNNVLNQYYVTAPGNPSIGGLYYMQFSYNIF